MLTACTVIVIVIVIIVSYYCGGWSGGRQVGRVCCLRSPRYAGVSLVSEKTLQRTQVTS